MFRWLGVAYCRTVIRNSMVLSPSRLLIEEKCSCASSSDGSVCAKVHSAMSFSKSKKYGDCSYTVYDVQSLTAGTIPVEAAGRECLNGYTPVAWRLARGVSAEGNRSAADRVRKYPRLRQLPR